MKILFQWDIKFGSKLKYEFSISPRYNNMREFKYYNKDVWGILEYDN